MSVKHSHLIVAGAQRCGTTSLFHYLNSHEAIYMAQPIRPEPKYFLSTNPSYEQYLRMVFHDAPKNVKYLGEKSTSYYEIPSVADRINQVLPDVKVIIQLRNPVERALSNYFFSVNNGLETRSVEEVFLLLKPAPGLSSNVSVNPFDYLGRSDYEKHVLHYKEIFGDRLLITSMERFSLGLESERLCSFLDIDFIPTRILKTNDVERMVVSTEVTEALQEHFRSKIALLESYLGFPLYNISE